MTGGELRTDASRWPSDDLTPPQGVPWDLLVIGGGSAGIVAAKTAAGFGASVLLVERERTGGDCLWTGCVPSKALLTAAHAAAQARSASRYGVDVAGVAVDFARVMAHVRQAITAIEPVDSPDTLRATGVRVAHGEAELTGPDTAMVGEITVTFRQALLATGSAPVIPMIPGLAEATSWTSATIWSLSAAPERLLVLGGGSIGCELGQAFARLGSAVTIVEATPRLLPREDADAARLITAALTADGVTVRTGAAVSAVGKVGAGWCAELADGRAVAFDDVLVAVGRMPRTGGLGLPRAGVSVDGGGYVRVNRRLQTANPRIWAAGDLTGHPQYTHTAGVHGALAASNAILGLRRTTDLATSPRVTFTQPELAAVGVSAADAVGQRGLTVRTLPHEEVDRAIAAGRVAGFTRLVLDRRGRVVGATIVGPRAGESLPEAVLAARHGLRARDLASSVHAYPTYGDGVWKASIAHVQDQLHQPGMRRVVAVAVAARRRWLSR
jgi:pyruvate/2-oxoglutarate dehydrogenase complex dihydrolipoamide dehydrogenase (E3) component